MFKNKIKDSKYKAACGIFVSLITCGEKVYAKAVETAGESQFWDLYGKLQKGLFFLGIFVSLFGLYLTLLKKEDIGKKLVIGSLGAYILSFLVPQLFILVRDTLGR